MFFVNWDSAHHVVLLVGSREEDEGSTASHPAEIHSGGCSAPGESSGPPCPMESDLLPCELASVSLGHCPLWLSVGIVCFG